MEVKEFINRIIQLGIDEKAIDSYVAMLNISSDELSEIRQNSFVIQWYATQVYISTRIITDRFSDEKIVLLYYMYELLFMTSDIKYMENTDSKSVILLKMDQHKIQYDTVNTTNGTRDIMGYSFIREIGECFARLCDKSESIVLRRLGSNLFGNCLNRCIEEFKFEKIEFKDL